ncbi:hypothetical protein SSS_10877 [Sarcoptes scabiei]|uniref:Uncharacterized protein n=1 Tax=Sarcoptes scabiei TaxID=52283 RepID=A0A834QY82_SARSC|nr:hypothetical protein SSS_10877 [Sarcoptes scabiei]
MNIEDFDDYDETYRPDLVIDQKHLDTLSRFDRNVRHLLSKGRDTNRNDCVNMLPDFKEAIGAASKVANEFRKILSIYNNFNDRDRDDDDRKSSKSYNRRSNRKKFNSKTISYSIQFGRKIYRLSFYWPKLLGLFLGTSD